MKLKGAMILGNYVFGIDVGGTTIKCGLLTLAGAVLDKWEIKTNTENKGASIITDIAQTIKDKCVEKEITLSDVIGVGVGIPGPVNAQGEVLVAVNLGWEKKNVKAELVAELGVKVEVSNDANVAALGELWLGCASGATDAVMFTLGTGVGGGVIVDGKVIAGTNGAGGEVGHLTVVPVDGNACNCGKTGCLETVASATGIVRETVKYLSQSTEASTLRSVETFEAKDVFDAAKANDAVALKMVDQLGMYIGLAAANLAASIDPEKIIIGGGVSKAGDMLIDAIVKHYQKFAFVSVKNTPFVIASLGNDAGIIGAASLVK